MEQWLLLVGMLVLAAAMFAGVALLYWAGFKGFRDQWARFSPEQRRRGRIAGAIYLALLLPGAVFAAVQPFGDRTLFYLGVALAAVYAVLTAVIAWRGITSGARRRPVRRTAHRRV